MKNLSFTLVLALLLALVPAVAAQTDLPNSYTSSSGITFNYPNGWFAADEDDNAVNLASLETGIVVAIRLGEGITDSYSSVDLSGDVASVAAAIQADLSGQGGTFGDTSSATIQGNPAVVTPFSFIGFGEGSAVITFQLADGTLGVMEIFALAGVAPTEEEFAQLIAVADSITFDPEAAAALAAEQADQPAIVAPAEALRPSQMPEGLMILSTGLSFQYPTERYATFDDEPVSESAILGTDNFLSTVSVIDFREDYSNISQFNVFLQFTAPIYIGIAEGEEFTDEDFANFNIDDYFETIETEDGRTIYRYASLIDEIDEAAGAVALYVVEARPGRFIWVQGQQLGGGDGQTFLDDVELMVQTMRYDESVITNAAPATDDSAAPSTDDGSALAPADGVTAFGCYDNAFSLGLAENASATVSCPASCTDGSVWGTFIYTADSSVCTAAVHAGLVDANTGGNVTVVILPGQAVYTGSLQNGIQTGDWGSYDQSFTVQPAQ